MQFVALDLETTGLDPKKDTIIEIAAIRFNIELEGGIFVIKNTEEHTQLIHPNRVLEQEVTMITGITNDMLIGKAHFDEVRDKVRDFIGDSIIVGHNVLFDIAMFDTHQIDLSTNIVLDTFELSEIFSQNIESLNLGFLANRYQLIDPDEVEHRALTDTKISIRLLLHYLNDISNLSGIKKQLWDTLISHDSSNILGILSKICRQFPENNINPDDFFKNLITIQASVPTQIESNQISEDEKNTARILYETHGNTNEEIDIIRNAFKKNTHLLIITPGYKASQWMSQLLTDTAIENSVTISVDSWCSIEHIQDLLSGNELFSRKKLILVLKIAFWLTETKTGLLDELKFYGDERTMLDIFRTQSDEWHIWRTNYNIQIQDIPVLISDISHWKGVPTNRFKIIKDIALLEDRVRRGASQEVSFDKFTTSIDCLDGDARSQEHKIHITEMISMIRSIYESIPERPTGPLAFPPGVYGETYFITQSMLWNKGHKWLIHATNAILTSWNDWKVSYERNPSREIRRHIQYIETSVQILSQYHLYTRENMNITLNIAHDTTKITLIPRSVQSLMKPLLQGSIGYGPNIGMQQTKGFLKREYGYQDSEFLIPDKRTLDRRTVYNEYHPSVIVPGSVILTTSQKHARDIGQTLRKIHGKKIEILIQGLSGGKGKMLSIFKKNIETTILVVIIDTWRDEYELWRTSRSIIIAKLPFDPPTDPYFLARTVGMSNNFSEYSEPIVIIRLNTLLERVFSSGFEKSVIITDSRLTGTEWGKKILSELL